MSFCIPCYGQDENPATSEDYKLVWADEFNGPALDVQNWTHDLGFGPKDDGWGVWGVQKYTDAPENSYIKDGKLVLKADHLGGARDGRNYTSGKITTQGKHSWRYGRIAARIKFPYGKGIFPAFWMLGEDFDIVGWPQCGEIDIAEMFGGGKGKDDVNLGAIHFEDQPSQAVFFGGKVSPGNGERLTDNFHDYEIEWDEKAMIFRFDGQEYHKESIDVNEHPERNEFHHKFFLIFNLGVGAYFESVGFPDETTVFPQFMEVDWVRVYQRG